MEHSYNKPEILGQYSMRYCSTWLRSLLCYIKKFVIDEFVIRVFHCNKILTFLRVGEEVLHLV